MPTNRQCWFITTFTFSFLGELVNWYTNEAVTLVNIYYILIQLMNISQFQMLYWYSLTVIACCEYTFQLWLKQCSRKRRKRENVPYITYNFNNIYFNVIFIYQIDSTTSGRAHWLYTYLSMGILWWYAILLYNLKDLVNF